MPLFNRKELEDLETKEKPTTDETSDEDVQELEAVNDSEENDKELEETEESDTDESSFGFNISDQIDRIIHMLELLKNDAGMGKETGGLQDLVGGMLSPHILENMPLSDVVLNPEDNDSLGKMRGKITMMTGKKSGDEPMHIKKKTINIGDENDDAEGPCCDLGDEEEDLHKIHDKSEAIVSSMMQANRKFAALSNCDDYAASLRESYKYAAQLAKGAETEENIANVLYFANPAKYANSLDRETLYVISGVISDIALCPPYSPEFYATIAERIKVAYHNLLGSSMVKQAYFMTQEEPTYNKGFNICPKFKTVKGAGIPVTWAFCQQDCIEGKPEEDGKVSCKYAYWLEHVADSHAKAMEKLDVHVNPDNEDMNLRLPDGQRSFAQRGYMKGLEQRLEEADVRGREWDDKKKATKVDSGASGKMLNYEALMDEILTAECIHRDDSGNELTTEQKLRKDTKESKESKTTEQRLYNKNEKEKKAESKNFESKLADKFGTLESFDHNKLMDELLENAYPRKDAKRPQESD